AVHRAAEPVDPLGIVLVLRTAEFQLAPGHGAALRARLCRGARGGPPGRDEPLPGVLGHGGKDAADHGTRTVLAGGARTSAHGLWRGTEIAQDDTQPRSSETRQDVTRRYP